MSEVSDPSMRTALDTAPGTIHWVVSGCALAFGLTLVAGGRLRDAYGRRRLMVICLVGFGLRLALLAARWVGRRLEGVVSDFQHDTSQGDPCAAPASSPPS